MNKQYWLPWCLAGAVAATAGCQAPQMQDQVATSSEAQPSPEAEPDPWHPRVRMETSLGDIAFELDAEAAAATVLNFVQYVQAGHYDGMIFHRVVKDSMIQGGGYTPDMEEKLVTDPPAVPDPWMSELTNKRGTIAMIHGRGGVYANMAQFFINVIDNLELDSAEYRGTYAVFGKVVEGMDTVEKIRNTPVGPHPKYAAGRSAVVPVESVVIKSVRLLTPFDPTPLKSAMTTDKAGQEDQIGALIKQLEGETGRKVVTTESGLRYVDLVVGTGPSPLLTDTVEFQYRGTLADGTEFESTYLTGPAVREVGRLIAGLQEGLTTMNEGGRRTLIIPAELGFGTGGIPGRIPSDATLIFEIELLEIK
ncbi:MAG: peptidylprolyl isomerase [Phycisphaerae bacterium]